MKKNKKKENIKENEEKTTNLKRKLSNHLKMEDIETNALIKTISKLDHTSLKHYLDYGLNVNHIINDWSLLHYACYSIENKETGTDKHIEIIKLLLDYGADINAKDESGWTPLHLVCQLGITNIIS